LSDSQGQTNFSLKKYNVCSYGAKGDVTTDDTAAIQSVFTIAPEGSQVYFPAGSYKTTAQLTVSRPIIIVGERGLSKIISDYAGQVLSIPGGPKLLSTALTDAVEEGDPEIILDSVIGISSGNMIFIQDTATHWPNDPRPEVFYGEVNVIKSIAGSVVTLFIPAATAYNAAVKVDIYSPWDGVMVKDMVIERINNTTNSAYGLTIANCRNAVIENCTFEGFGGSGITEYNCVENMYRWITCKNGFYSGIGLGYGIQIRGSILTQVVDSVFQYYRRGVDFSGEVPARHCMAKDCIAYASIVSVDEASGFGTHGSAEYCNFENCSVVGGKNAFVLRGNYIKLINCESMGTYNVFVAIGAGHGDVIQGCHCNKGVMSSGTNPFLTASFIDISSPSLGVGLNNVKIYDCDASVYTWFIYIASTSSVTQIDVANTHIWFRLNTGEFIKTANFASPITIRVNMSDVTNRTLSGADFAIRTSAGTNVTLIVSDTGSVR
jgi:hypothetical protein